MSKVPTSHSVRRAVRLALLTGAAAAIAAPAQAQEAGTLQEVVVTGSRIQRPDYASASPVMSINDEAFKQTGVATVETLLNTLPQFVPSVTSTSNNPSNGGQANVELRGLGTTRTLVLLDGKRIVPANGTGVVDLNLLPSSIIETVEVVTGGASAAYGSDAVAGVVNFKTKNVEGIIAETNWGQTAKSDGEEWSASLTGGSKFADGRGHAMLNVSYFDRTTVLGGDRDHSRIALGYDDPGFSPSGSTNIEEGAVTLVGMSEAARNDLFKRYGFADGASVGSRFGFNSDGTLFTTGDNTSGSVLNFKGAQTDSFNDAAYTYNHAPTNYLQLPMERKSAFGRASFEITPDAEIYVQGLVANYVVNTQLAPTPGSNLFVPVNNRFMPEDLRELALSRTDADAPISLTKRLTEMGPRFEKNEYDVYQVLAGVTGNVFGSSWRYDVYGSYGEVEVENTQKGSLSRTRFEELAFAADGGESICGGMNPFGMGSISQACADYMKVDAINYTNVKQTIAEASLSGPLFALPAGDLSGAVGVMYKKDEFSFIADEGLRARTDDRLGLGLPPRADVAGFNASDNTIGKTDSTEVFVEALVPVLADKPFVEKLDLTLGYRYADYSTAGGVNSYKSELSYQPVSPLRFRGSYQRAVRAPNISELFQPQVTNFPSITKPDPCSVNSAQRNGANGDAVKALCQAQGISDGLIGSYSNTSGQAEGLAGGNPNLQEETADTYSLGFVFQSPSDNPWLSNLQVSVDWYKISIEDAIQSVSARVFVDRCYNAAYNPDFSVDNFYCSFFTRNTANGEITNALELEQNIGAVRTDGVDVQVDWSADVGPGLLRVNTMATWLGSYEEQELPGDAFTNYTGTIGETIGSVHPKWKGTTHVGYNIGDVGLSARWRYVHGMKDVAFEDFKVPSASYFDVSASYAFSSGVIEGLSLRAGVNNVGDKQPQLYPSYVQSNTDPSTYDILGRRYFFSASYRF